MKIGLYLMTSKGHRVLRAAFDCGVTLSHVTTANAAGMNDGSHRLIAKECKERGVPVFTLAHPPEFAGDWSIAAGWRRMLDVPNLIVIHDSLLPRYRGFSPLITALINGEPTLGATAFLAKEEPDTGPIVVYEEWNQVYPVKIKQVIERMEGAYESIAHTVFERLDEDGTVDCYEQDHSKATYSLFRDEEDYVIDWSRRSHEIERFVDAVGDPFPGAFTTMTGWGGVRVHDVDLQEDWKIEDRVPGKVAYLDSGRPVIACGAGMVRINDLRAEDGRSLLPMERHKVRFG